MKQQQPGEQSQHVKLGAMSVALALALCATAAQAASTVTTTTSYDYDTATGQLKKTITEPGSPDLCLVTEYTPDPYGRPRTTTTRNCKGAAPVAPGAMPEAAAPTGLAVFADRSTTNTYTADQRFVGTVTNPLGQSESRTYDGRFGTPASLTDANDLATTWTYDGLGRKVLEVRPDGTRTRWTYVFCTYPGNPYWPTAPTGAATATCEAVQADSSLGVTSLMPVYYAQATPLQADGETPIGPYTRVYFDTLGREVRTESQAFDSGSTLGQVIYQNTTYDKAGNVAYKGQPYTPGFTSNVGVGFKHDALGRVTRQTEVYAAGGMAVVSTAYSGLTTTVTDPRGFTTTQVSNAAGQLSSTTDAEGGTLQRSYDPLGNLAQTVDAAGNATSFVYDIRGRKTASYDPDMGVWTYTYNAAGELVLQVDAKQQDTELTYDALGRMTRRKQRDLISHWYHDHNADGSACGKGIGQLCEAVADNSYRRRQVYDSLGRPASQTVTLGTAAYASSIGYDTTTGRVVSQTYPTGLQIKHEYTALGYPLKVIDARTDTALWTANVRDALGHLRQYTYGNGLVTSNTYFSDGRLKSTQTGTSGSVQSLRYAYDLNRNISSRMDLVTGVTATYSHDGLNRLTGESRAGGGLSGTHALGWSYDAIGNITARTEAGVSAAYSYRPSGRGSLRPHAVAGVSGTVGGATNPAYHYDNNGSLTVGAGRTLSWTSANMVGSVTLGSARLDYHYGPTQDRVQETLVRAGVVQRTTVYIHPGGGGGLFYEEETGAAGTRMKHYVTAGGATIAVIVCTAAPCTSPANTTTQYWHEDHLGSVSVVTTEAGAVVERMAYEPFGKRRHGDGRSDPDGALVPGTDRGFTEQEHIDEVGLINFNGRVYDPALARFISADPTVPYPASTQSYNRYSYGRNNPMRMLDPSGFVDIDVNEPCWSCSLPIYDTPTYDFSNYGSPYYGSPSDGWSFATLPGDITCFSCGTVADPFSYWATNTSPGAGGGISLTGLAMSGADMFFIGGYGGLFDQALANGEYAASAGYFGAAIAYGIANAFTLGGGPAITSSVRALGTGLSELVGAAAAKAQPLLVTKEVQFGLCFAEGTPVHTTDGLKPIEEVRPGDLVAARDEQTGQLSWRPVVRVFRNEQQEVVRLTYADQAGAEETLGVTPEHPFRVAGRGWVGAAALRAGDRIERLQGGALVVRGLVRDGGRHDTFNFEVADVHTYFVGVAGAWVHNASVIGDAAKGFSRGVENVASFKNLNEARASARQFSGLGDNAVNFVQEIGPLKGQITGRMSPDGLRGWRLDFDPTKGFHVNWWDRSAGPKRADWLYGANKIEGGTLDQFWQTLQHFPKN